MGLEQIKEYYKNSSGIIRGVLSPIARAYCGLTGRHILRVDAWLLTGKERHSGQPLTVAFSGSEQNKNYWARLAFGDLFEETPLGTHSRRRIPGLIRSCGKEVDLFAELCDQTFSLSPSHGTPFSIPVSVEGDMDIDSINFSGKSIKKALRKIEKNEFSYEIVTDPAFLKNFVETIYPPCLNKKYLGECLFESYRKLTRRYDRIEGLFIVKDGQRISGALLCYKEDRVDFKCQAILPGYEELSREGSTAAIDYYATVYFKANPWPNISLGGSRPFFHDGLLLWKKKWGLRLTRSGSMVQRLHLIKNSTAAQSFLENNPFISVHHNALVGVVFISGKEASAPDAEPQPAAYAWPGLERVIVYCLDQPPAIDGLQDDRIVFRSADKLFEHP